MGDFLQNLSLQYLAGTYTIHRFPPDGVLPDCLFKSSFYTITRTVDELSVVCEAELTLPGSKVESDWACFKVLGPLDFALTGVLARLATTLAEAQVSIFAVSTFDTDYVLHKNACREKAVDALRNAGYEVLSETQKP